MKVLGLYIAWLTYVSYQKTHTLCALYMFSINTELTPTYSPNGGRDSYKLKAQTQIVLLLISMKTSVFMLKTA